MMMPTVAILAGGLATRLRPISETIPKSLVDVAGKPFLFHQFDLLKAAGITDVVICAGHLAERIQETIPTENRWGLQVKFSLDGPTLLGTGGAIRNALPLLSDPFFVLYGDSYLPIPMAPIVKAFPENALGLMTVFRNDNQWDVSNIQFEGNRIIQYDKRSPTPSMHHIDYGLSLLRKEALAKVPPAVACDLSDIFVDLIRHEKMSGWESPERFFEIGSPKGLEELRKKLSAGPRRNDKENL